MNGTNSLDISLKQKGSGAVDEAKRLGEDALPVIEKYSQDEDYEKRRLAVECAGVIRHEKAAPILAAGLEDDNINVRLEAAIAIDENPIPGVTDAVLEILENSQEDDLREILTLAAGKLPGEKTVEVLKKVQKAEEGKVSENAEMALAKLGDGESKEAIVKELSEPLPRTRYEALQKLIYIDDTALASYAKKLLGDESVALTIGTVRNPGYRRVCDQAVDTIIYLLRLSVTFEASEERIYDDREIHEVISKSR